LLLDEVLRRPIVVVGSGRTAAPVAAALAAIDGANVSICARNPEKARMAAQAATEHAGRPVHAGDLGRDQIAAAGLVVESIVEDLTAKQDLFGRLDAWADHSTVLATNTSSLSIKDVGSPLRDPSRLAGLHFLHPAHETSVVEIVSSNSSSATIETLRELGHAMGKRPLVLEREVPGFIWNRIQFAVLRECLDLLDDGVATVEDIDAAVSQGLAPRWLVTGPLSSADLGGLDTFSRVAAQLFPELTRSPDVSPTLSQLAKSGDHFSPGSMSELGRIRQLRRRAQALAVEVAAIRSTPVDGQGS